MSTHKIDFYEELTKSFSSHQISSNMHLICSSVCLTDGAIPLTQIRIFKPLAISVAEQQGLHQTWPETWKIGFLPPQTACRFYYQYLFMFVTSLNY